METVRRIAGVRNVQPDVRHWSYGAGTGIDRDAFASAGPWDIDAGRRGLRVDTRNEIREGVVEVNLRSLVIEANAEIQSQPRVHAPVVLNVELGIPVLCVEYRARRRLAVRIHISQQRIGITVGGVAQGVIGIRSKIEVAFVSGC